MNEPNVVPHIMSPTLHSVTVDAALWASSICPDGILERWRVADGAVVAVGDVIAELRIECALHEVTAPGAGRLAHCAVPNDIVEPGSLLCTLQGN